VTEASFVGTLVNYHGVLHVVTRVGNDSNDGVGTRRTLVKIVVLVLQGSYEGCLGEQDSVHFIVHAVRMGMVGRSHSLFGHLALIHVSGRLVVITEWNCRGNDRQHVDWVDLLMCHVSTQVFS